MNVILSHKFYVYKVATFKNKNNKLYDFWMIKMYVYNIINQLALPYQWNIHNIPIMSNKHEWQNKENKINDESFKKNFLHDILEKNPNF